MLEFNPDTPYLNVKRLIDEFERASCGGVVPEDPHARRLRVGPGLAFAMLVLCDRLKEIGLSELGAVAHADGEGAGTLRLVPN